MDNVSSAEDHEGRDRLDAITGGCRLALIDVAFGENHLLRERFGQGGNVCPERLVLFGT